MKKILSFIIGLALIFPVAFMLTGCGSKKTCYVTIDDTDLEGISITCSSSYTDEDGTTKDGCIYDGTVYILVSLEVGYAWGDFELTINGTKATEHDYYVSCTTNSEGTQKNYEFGSVRKDLIISYTGNGELEEYTVNITASNEINSELTDNVRELLQIQYIFVVGGEEETSTYASWKELKASLQTNQVSKTMHYGDKLIIKNYYNMPLGDVVNVLGNFSPDTTSYKYNDEEFIITTQEYIITDDLSLRLDETYMEIEHAVTANLKGFGTDDYRGDILYQNTIKNDVLSSYSYYEDYSLVFDFSSYSLVKRVLEDYTSSTLSFTINGYMLDKSNISYDPDSAILKISNIKAPFQYKDVDGNYKVSPRDYHVEIIGVEAYLETISSDILMS